MSVHPDTNLSRPFFFLMTMMSLLLLPLATPPARAQEASAAGKPPTLTAASIEQSGQQPVPSLVPFAGKLSAHAGQRVALQFSLYATATGNQPLWSEDQTVEMDPHGEYSVLLGAGSSIGLPHVLFAGGEPRWLAVEIRGEKEVGERTLLTSVAYAMKSASADTLGGVPAASFVTLDELEARLHASASALATQAVQAVTAKSTAGTITGVTAGAGLTGGGTTGKVTLAVDSKKVPLLSATNAFAKGATFGGETTINGSSTDWMFVVTNTNSAPAKGTLLSQAIGSNTAIEAASPGGIAVRGESTSGYGGYFTNVSTTQAAVYANNSAGNAGLFLNNSATHTAVAGENSSTSAAAAGTYGSAPSGKGVYGISTSGQGVYGTSTSGTGTTGISNSFIGVNGISSKGTGVLGSQPDLSSEGTAVQAVGIAVGAWGDGISSGVVGTSDDGSGGTFINDSNNAPAVFARNDGGGPNNAFATFIAETSAGVCGIGGKGDVTCTGQMKSVVTTASARQVETYSVQSSENWLEDYGSGQLVNGKVTIHLDAAFVDAANTGVAYHVFLTPKGDAQPLYLTNETVAGFEVRESGKGGDNISFDYRIVAKRRGLETQRMVDVTEQLKSEVEAARPKQQPRRKGAVEVLQP